MLHSKKQEETCARVDKEKLQEKQIMSQKKSSSLSNVQNSGSFVEFSLDAILNVEKVRNETKETIIEMWNLYHSNKHAISASIGADVYRKLHEKSKKFPTVLKFLT
jgi:hypothetical protein